MVKLYIGCEYLVDNPNIPMPVFAKRHLALETEITPCGIKDIR
jgi:hypothetical protein